MFPALVAGLRPASILAVVLCGSPLVGAQQVSGPAAPPAPVADLAHYQLSEATLQALALPDAPDAPFSFGLRVGEEWLVVHLARVSVRSDKFQLLVQQADGAIVPVEPAAPATVRGGVEGRPGSVVAGSLIDGRLEALVRLGDELPLIGVQPSTGGARGDHVVYDASAAIDVGGVCGTPDLPGGFTPPAGAAPDGGPVVPADICEIACDADVEFYNQNSSSVSATQLDIENIINGVEAIYESEVAILYEITTILVRSAEPDPYGAFGGSAMLSEFTNTWNSDHADIDRDVAHFFTGKNITGSTIGIAQLGVICALSQAYGLSQSKYTNNFTNRVGLTAHELGHNWNAQHCDGQGDCRIMCSCLGCCGPVTTFGNSAESSITTKAAQANCLDSTVPPPVPSLTSLSPLNVKLLSTGTVTINGSFEDVTQLTIGSTVLLPGQFSQIGDALIHVAPPTPSALGPVPVTISNEAGTSNALTLTYVGSNPPVVFTPLVAFPGDDITWNMAAEPGQTVTLFIALSPQTFPYQGFNVLVNLVILWSGSVDSLGLVDLSAPVPATASGLTIYTQIASTDPSLVGISSSVLTLVP